MTTIAASLTEMAADSKVTDNGSGTQYHTTKIFALGTECVGVAGDVGATNKFLNWVREGYPPCPPEFGDLEIFAALILSRDGLHYYSNCCFPDKIVDEFYSIGSGSQAAIAAMKLGKTPSEAVALACQIDPASGGPVQTINISELGTKRVRSRLKQ